MKINIKQDKLVINIDNKFERAIKSSRKRESYSIYPNLARCVHCLYSHRDIAPVIQIRKLANIFSFKKNNYNNNHRINVVTVMFFID